MTNLDVSAALPGRRRGTAETEGEERTAAIRTGLNILTAPAYAVETEPANRFQW
jgi:hypothetical protein